MMFLITTDKLEPVGLSRGDFCVLFRRKSYKPSTSYRKQADKEIIKRYFLKRVCDFREFTLLKETFLDNAKRV